MVCAPKRFTIQVVLFATRLNSNYLYMYQQFQIRMVKTNRHNMSWLRLSACTYPSGALKHKVIHKIHQYNRVAILIAPGCPLFGSLYNSQQKFPTFYCVNTSYLVDRCICPAPCRSRQTLEKNVLSWALAGTGSVLFIRQVAV